MEILPIGSLTYPDKAVFGIDLYNLSQLKRLGFLIPEGIIISPPDIILRTVLEATLEKKTVISNQKEKFEQSLTIIKSKILKIPPPKELEQELKVYSNHGYFFKGEIYFDKSQLWKKLLENWLNEIRGRIWNLGFASGITQNLTSEAIFFVKEKFEPGQAFFDPEKDDETVISFQKSLSPTILHSIDQMVIEGNKKLFIPQIYELIKINERVYLTGLKPFTQSIPLSKSENIILPKTPRRKIFKSAIKVFLNLNNGFTIDRNIDGLLIEGEHSSDFEGLVFRLTEGALSYPTKLVFFKLPDIDDGQLKSGVRLLHNKKSLDEACSAFLFARNKKTLLNIELVVPKVNSLDDFLELKRELASRNITRKGNMKIWLEMGVPENLINIEGYIDSGIDGVLLSLDYLQKQLIDATDSQPDLIKIHVATVTKFLEPYLKKLHQAKILFVAKGALILHPDILDFLIEKGCFGIVANTPMEAENFPEQLWGVEKRILQRKSFDLQPSRL